jgi:hypothetical protein
MLSKDKREARQGHETAKLKSVRPETVKYSFQKQKQWGNREDWNHSQSNAMNGGDIASRVRPCQ